jgi:cell division protein FtsN
MRAALITVVLTALIAGAPLAGTSLVAQGPAVDNAVARARALVEAGNGRAGRLVLDSLVQEAGMASPALGELLYWRGLLSESSSEAERDWRRLLLEVPMSPRAEDALLRLAQLEQLRGRPAESRTYLERMVRDYREPASQARGFFWLAKAWLDENDKPRACGALEVVRRDAPSNAVELRTQADDLARQCRGVTAIPPSVGATTVAAAPAAMPIAPAAPPVDTARVNAAQRADSLRLAREAALREAALRDSLTEAAQRDSLAREAAAREAAAREVAARDSARNAATARPANARYSVQLSALNTLRQAEQFAQRYRAQGIDARVDGTTAPFRVRTGYFATRAQANARLAELKAKGYDGFVAELTP